MPAPPPASTSAAAAAPATTTAPTPSSAAPPLANGSSQLHPELQRPAQPVRDFGFAQCSGREALSKTGKVGRVDDGLNASTGRSVFSFFGLPSPSICLSLSLPPPKKQRPFQLPAPASSLAKVLAGMRHTFVVADATLPDCPLVYASEG